MARHGRSLTPHRCRRKACSRIRKNETVHAIWCMDAQPHRGETAKRNPTYHRALNGQIIKDRDEIETNPFEGVSVLRRAGSTMTARVVTNEARVGG